MTSNQRRSRLGAVRPGWSLAVGWLGCVAALVGYVVVAGPRIYRVTGDSYPGLFTAAAEPVGFFTAMLAGALTVGALAHVVMTARPTDSGVIDAPAYAAHLLAERASAIWAVMATAMVVIQASHSAGVPVGDVITSAALPQTIVASEMARAWVVVAVAAVMIAVTVRLSVRWVTHATLIIPALIGTVAVPVSGNAGQGPDHDYATSTAIVFAAAFAATAGLKLVAALVRPPGSSARRVLAPEIILGAIALLYGGALFGILTAATDPAASAYGWAGIAALVLGAAVWIQDVVAWRRRLVPGLPRRLPTALVVVAIIALYASMATQPAPRFLNHQFSTWDVFLGYSLPEPPSVFTVLFGWRFDTFLGAAALVFAGLYLIGYLRLRRRGDAWPVGRLAAWLTGCLVLLFTTSSGVKAYGSAMFSVHMAEHMTLNMFVPVLLVLGGPVTLALRVLPAAGDGQPGPREWLLWLIHSRFTAILSNPITAFVLFVASLYAVYFTPIFDTLVRYHWGHELMSVHFLVVGYLFFWAIIGIDPGPRRLPFLGRLGMLFAVMPFHAFFGIATMNTTSIIGGQFYRFVDLPWLASIGADQHLGGAIAWGSSELPVIVVVVALVAQWARHDRRAAVRSDRHSDANYADDDFDAYNAMLHELARKRQ